MHRQTFLNKHEVEITSGRRIKRNARKRKPSHPFISQILKPWPSPTQGSYGSERTAREGVEKRMTQQISPLRCGIINTMEDLSPVPLVAVVPWHQVSWAWGKGCRQFSLLPSSFQYGQESATRPAKAMTFTGTIIPESQARFKPFWKMGSRHQLKLPAGMTMLLIWVPVPLGVPVPPTASYFCLSHILAYFLLFIYTHISTRVIVKHGFSKQRKAVTCLRLISGDKLVDFLG